MAKFLMGPFGLLQRKQGRDSGVARLPSSLNPSPPTATATCSLSVSEAGAHWSPGTRRADVPGGSQLDAGRGAGRSTGPPEAPLVIYSPPCARPGTQRRGRAECSHQAIPQRRLLPGRACPRSSLHHKRVFPTQGLAQGLRTLRNSPRIVATTDSGQEADASHTWQERGCIVGACPCSVPGGMTRHVSLRTQRVCRGHLVLLIHSRYEKTETQS